MKIYLSSNLTLDRLDLGFHLVFFSQSISMYCIIGLLKHVIMAKRRLSDIEMDEIFVDESESDLDLDDSMADQDWLPEPDDHLDLNESLVELAESLVDHNSDDLVESMSVDHNLDNVVVPAVDHNSENVLVSVVDHNCLSDASDSNEDHSDDETNPAMADAALHDSMLQVTTDEDSDDANDIGTANWTDYVGRQKVFRYTGQSGLQWNVSTSSTPLDLFFLIINDAVIDHIVCETNRYAHQKISSSPPKKYRRLNKWIDTDADEIKRFLGLVLWMGLVRISSLDSYWASGGIYKQVIPRLVMSRNRFQLLLSMIHFNNNEEMQQGDRLAKIQPLVDLLESNFQSLFYPAEDVVIDESLLPWRGRLIFRQYIPNKAHRYGVKLYKLCSVDGYTWALKIYSGKSATGGRQVGLAKQVCLDLLQKLLGEGRTLYVDNYYTSYDLALSLLQNNTHLVGTLRANKKGIPKNVLKAKLNKGEMISREDPNGVVVLKWKDQRDVRMLTTKHAPVMEKVSPTNVDKNQPTTSNNSNPVAPPTRRGRRRATEKPQPILAYNKAKMGIDLSDQMTSYASTLRKGVKWYRKVAFELLLGMSVVNAWVVYKHITQKKIGIRAFRDELTSKVLNINELLKPTPVTGCKDKDVHLLLKRVNDSGKSIRRPCRPCYSKFSKQGGRQLARQNAKKVCTYCDKCPDQPSMCINCFNDHQK